MPERCASVLPVSFSSRRTKLENREYSLILSNTGLRQRCLVFFFSIYLFIFCFGEENLGKQTFYDRDLSIY